LGGGKGAAKVREGKKGERNKGEGRGKGKRRNGRGLR